MHRLLLLLGTLLLLAGCGADDETGPIATEVPLEPTARFTVSDIGDALDGGGLEVVRAGQPGGSDVEPEPVEAVRYEDRSGTEFDVLLYEDAASAQDAADSLFDPGDGGSVTTAYNAVALLPEPPRDGVSRRVFSVFRDLRVNGARRIDLGELLRDHEELLGASVIVRGDVVERLPNDARRPRAIALRGPGGDEVLVLPARGERLDLPPTDAVRVRGQLALVGRSGLGIGSRDEVLAHRKGDPMIVADAVRAG